MNQEELLAMFPPDSGYTEMKAPDGGWYVKRLLRNPTDPTKNKWNVAYYATEEKFKRYKQYQKRL